MKPSFDLIILGGGAGAFAAAIRANELKAKTAIVNDGLPIGGTCVNVGCVPSKTLIHAAEILHHAQHHGIPGVELSVKQFDFKRVVEDELKLVKTMRNEKYETVLENLEHVTFFNGKGIFVSPNEVEVNGPAFAKSTAGKETLQAEKIIIATGSTATVPPIEGIRDVGYLTHIEALKLEKLPKKLIVIGAGPVALEFAQIFARFGTRVTLLVRSRIFRPGEEELTKRLGEVLEKEGIFIKTGTTAQSVRKENGKKILTCSVNGKDEDIATDEILLAIGKTPNTGELQLDKAGVEIEKNHSITVSPVFQTSQSHIYAVGDVANLPLRLEPTAGNEGSLAAENALTGSQKNIDYRTVPYTIFTDPQLAGVGFTEEEQMKEMGVCACRTVDFTKVPKAIITRRTQGLIKMAIHPEAKVIMGVHILSPHAGELIAEAMMLVKNKNTIDDVMQSLPMFPTLAEAIKIVAMSFTKDISKLSCCV